MFSDQVVLLIIAISCIVCGAALFLFWLMEETKRQSLAAAEETKRRMLYSENFLPEMRDRVAKSVFFISVNNEFSGTGVAVTQNLILSCEHLLPTPTKQRKKKKATIITARRYVSGVLSHEYTVAVHAQDKMLDLVIFKISESDARDQPLAPLDFFDGEDPSGGEKCVLVSYDRVLTHHFSESYPQLQFRAADVMSAVAKTDKFLYNAISVQGNSGGAVVVKNGSIFGVHSEIVTAEGSDRGCAVGIKKSAVVAFICKTLLK